MEIFLGMKIMEVKRQDANIVIYDNDKKIEVYEFNKEIDFSGLVNYLIECDFISKIELTDTVDNKSEQETNLIMFIKRIIEDYNSKVDRFMAETKITD